MKSYYFKLQEELFNKLDKLIDRNLINKMEIDFKPIEQFLFKLKQNKSMWRSQKETLNALNPISSKLTIYKDMGFLSEPILFFSIILEILSNLVKKTEKQQELQLLNDFEAIYNNYPLVPELLDILLQFYEKTRNEIKNRYPDLSDVLIEYVILTFLTSKMYMLDLTLFLKNEQ